MALTHSSFVVSKGGRCFRAPGWLYAELNVFFGGLGCAPKTHGSPRERPSSARILPRAPRDCSSMAAPSAAAPAVAARTNNGVVPGMSATRKQHGGGARGRASKCQKLGRAHLGPPSWLGAARFAARRGSIRGPSGGSVRATDQTPEAPTSKGGTREVEVVFHLPFWGGEGKAFVVGAHDTLGCWDPEEVGDGRRTSA